MMNHRRVEVISRGRSILCARARKNRSRFSLAVNMNLSNRLISVLRIYSTALPSIVGNSDLRRGLRVRNRSRVFVNRLQIVVGHIPENRPGHHLQERPKLRVQIVEILPGTKHFHELTQRQSSPQVRRRLWRNVAGSEGPELRTPAKRRAVLNCACWPRNGSPPGN
jgi:hypothetical protein